VTAAADPTDAAEVTLAERFNNHYLLQPIRRVTHVPLALGGLCNDGGVLFDQAGLEPGL
jgi:hypothetical protein